MEGGEGRGGGAGMDDDDEWDSAALEEMDRLVEAAYNKVRRSRGTALDPPPPHPATPPSLSPPDARCGLTPTSPARAQKRQATQTAAGQQPAPSTSGRAGTAWGGGHPVGRVTAAAAEAVAAAARASGASRGLPTRGMARPPPPQRAATMQQFRDTSGGGGGGG